MNSSVFEVLKRVCLRMCARVLARTHSAFMHDAETKGKIVRIKLDNEQKQNDAYENYKQSLGKSGSSSG